MALQLARAYAAQQRVGQLDNLVSQLIAAPELSQEDFLQLASFYVPLNRGDRVLAMLNQFVQRFPQNPVGWYNLALVNSARGNCDEAIPALARSLALDDAQQHARALAKNDSKLDNCRRDPRFQRLLEQPEAAGNSSSLPFNISR